MPAKNKDYLSTREAAELLSVAVSTVQLWTNDGLLKAWTTAGGHRRIAKSSVEEMLKQKQAIIENKKANKERPLSIVVVEDNEQEVTLYEQQFALWGMDVDVKIFKDGYSGLINIGRILPDIIISDLMMPKMDGFEMIKAIKKNPELEDCKLIVVSALTTDEIRIRGGLPDDVITFRKPLPFNELETLIREVNRAHAN
jgi:excisionase family DNA binding protein